jgi:hypothetical protein
MRTKDPYRIGKRMAACLAACALGLGAVNAFSETGSLLQARVVALGAADLENAFWVCDYTATTRGMDATPAGLCSAVYDEIKARKFDGDFERLLGWWRQNKPAEHARLEARER